jgi:hypothetical protein
VGERRCRPGKEQRKRARQERHTHQTVVGICELGVEAKGRAGAVEEHASCAGKRHW